MDAACACLDDRRRGTPRTWTVSTFASFGVRVVLVVLVAGRSTSTSAFACARRQEGVAVDVGGFVLVVAEAVAGKALVVLEHGGVAGGLAAPRSPRPPEIPPAPDGEQYAGDQ